MSRHLGTLFPRSVGILLLAASHALGASAALPQPPMLDPQTIESWVDGQVAPALEGSGVPGALVVVVRHDQVLLAKGYGLADVRQRTPMRTDLTLYDVASIGKSMTAVVAEQLIDEGKLNLDEDVNHYLKSAHVTGPKVTLRMLLGHRGGFESDLTGLFAPFDGNIEAHPGELDRRLRPLVTPDTRTAYDNQGYGLVGLILQGVTGEPLPQLFRERLFTPAGMTSAVAGRPPDGKARTARCYVVHGPGHIRECEYWLYREGLIGAGGISATGDDMARYMRLLLGRGTIDQQQVLSSRAFEDLTDFSSYRFNAGMPGFARSFTQLESHRGIEYAHGGDMPGFASIMKIYPDADVAIFVGILGGNPGSFDARLSDMPEGLEDGKVDPNARPWLMKLKLLQDAFAELFIPQAWPRSSSGPAMWPDPGADGLEDDLGHYVLAHATNRLPYRIITALSGIIVARAGPDAITVAGQGPFKHIGAQLYENAKGDRVAFAARPTGRLMAVQLSPAQFRKVSPINSPTWILPFVALAMLILTSSSIHLGPRGAARLRRLARLSIVGSILVIAGLLLEWQYGVALAVVRGDMVLSSLWRLGLHVGALILAWSAIDFVIRRDNKVGRPALVHGYLIVLADVVIVAALLLWRVLGAFPPWISS